MYAGFIFLSCYHVEIIYIHHYLFGRFKGMEYYWNNYSNIKTDLNYELSLLYCTNIFILHIQHL